jgi:hypothetical protein
MTENIENVFGNGTNAPTIPADAVIKLREVVEEFGLDGAKDTVKGQFVELLNNPAVQAQGEGRWITAVRALRSYYAGRAYVDTRGRLVHFMPFVDVTQAKAEKPKDTDSAETPPSFAIRVFGLLKSAEADYDFEGPAEIRITRFQSADAANAFVANLRRNTVYALRATPSKTNPSGKLSGGLSGFFFVEGNQTATPVAFNADPFWANAVDRLFEYVPTANLSELILTGTENRLYHVEAEIIQSRTGATKDGRPNGSFTLLDDSVTKDVAKAAKGGVFLWLPKEYISLGALPLGSRVSVLLSGYIQDETAPDGSNTGNSAWRWKLYAAKTLVDLSGGVTIPSPETPAVSIPATQNAEL